MIILERSKFTPSVQTGILVIFSLGVLTSITLIIAALVAVAWLLNLAMTAIAELSTNIAHLFTHADPFTQLLLLCVVGYCLFKLARSAYRSLK